MNDEQLTQFFRRSEFACKCGCGRDTIDARTLQLCDEVRLFVAGPVFVTSGFRCPAHNSIIGGAKNSQHLLGRAADLLVPRPVDVYEFLLTQYPDRYGFGLYDRFVHVDTRSGPPARWDFRS